jgi:hypothetical protein
MAESSNRIERIKVIGQGPTDPENGNEDVHLYLEDGRIYSFVMATPNNIYWCMDNEGIDYFFGIPPLFVKSLSTENIRRAFEALLSEDDERWLEVYGVRQTK